MYFDLIVSRFDLNLRFLSVSGGSGEGKAKKKQNVVPVQISEILNAPEEGFTVEGCEVGMVLLVGKVVTCEKATTKTTYRVSMNAQMIILTGFNNYTYIIQIITSMLLNANCAPYPILLQINSIHQN